MTIPIKGINHITFSVSDLDASVMFYQGVFEAELVFRGERTAYLDLAGLWLALNVQTELPRQEIHQSYTHLAFTIDLQDMERMEQRLHRLSIPMRRGRLRDEGEGTSLYFADPDGHLFEFHAGDRETRIQAYETNKTASKRLTAEL